MTAGYNLKVRFWRYSYPADDPVGGALPSGTVIYENISGRIQASSPIAAFVAEGLQTDKIMQGLFEPASIVLREYDQCEVTSPIGHPYLGLMFRIHTVQYPNIHPQDNRGYLIVTMTRTTRHANQFQ